MTRVHGHLRCRRGIGFVRTPWREHAGATLEARSGPQKAVTLVIEANRAAPEQGGLE